MSTTISKIQILKINPVHHCRTLLYKTFNAKQWSYFNILFISLLELILLLYMIAVCKDSYVIYVWGFTETEKDRHSWNHVTSVNYITSLHDVDINT